MSAAGPPQSARPLRGKRRAAPHGGHHTSAAGPPQSARPLRGKRHAAPHGGRHASVATFRVAAIQTVSGNDVAANLAAIEPLVADAAGQGAQLVLLPEYFGIFGTRA